MRSFMPLSASRIISASSPAPAITAKCSPFKVPVSIARRSPCRPMRTASGRSVGTPRLVASRFAVPAGRIATSTSDPASASMQRCTVPSPPHTKTRPAPFSSASRAQSGACLLFATSNQGDRYPAASRRSRNSPIPPPNVFPECAITATVLICPPFVPSERRRGGRPVPRDGGSNPDPAPGPFPSWRSRGRSAPAR